MQLFYKDSALARLFNECLKFEVYPWNTTLITPLHKKGCPHEPDNYRAIAVGSNIGKLFSSLLLNRLLEFRSIHCPDTPNQRGFCKDAQTADHIFSLNTCIEKYVKKQRKRLYSCFVDFQKAFDSVSWEALLFKLGQLGIEGRFFNCLKHMYENSSAKLKMAKKLSECFNIESGTEQGHPQVNLGLEWYTSVKALYERFDQSATRNLREGSNFPKPNSKLIKSRVEDWFKAKWDKARKSSSKLTFYNSIKDELHLEPYVKLKNHKRVKSIAWLRTSSHRLNVETGRYGSKLRTQSFITLSVIFVQQETKTRWNCYSVCQMQSRS